MLHASDQAGWMTSGKCAPARHNSIQAHARVSGLRGR